MKKSKMPAQLKIGGINYKVLYPYLFETNPSMLGLHDSELQTIKVSKLFCNKERSWPRVCETVFHESLHAVDKIYCGAVMYEDEVYAMSNWLYQVIRDNDLKIRAGKLPEYVKIGGFKYMVIPNYDYTDDEDTVGSVDYELSRILIATKNSNGQNYGVGYVMSTFIYLLTCAICELSTIPRGFKYAEETDGCMNHHIAFSNGIYQIFVDNDLERLLKSDAELVEK